MSEWIDYANESRLVNGIGEIVATIKHLGGYYNHPPIYAFDNRQFQTLEAAKRIAEGSAAPTTKPKVKE